MEIAAVIARARQSRTVQAALLLVAALAVLLVAWFWSGWSDVRAQQRVVRETPVTEARVRASELAHELRAELSLLVAREVERPYFHYQNLFHDPRSGDNWSVAPSPLSEGPHDPLVLGYFQLDDKGRLTTPTINDEVPELSAQKHLAANQRFRDAVAQTFPEALRPLVMKGALVASLASRAQRVTIDPSSYVQNNMPSRVFEEQNRRAPPTPLPESSRAASKVTITISPLEWRTLPLFGAPALVAVRHVATPDGNFAQGFVVDRAALRSWVATRADDHAAEVRDVESPNAIEVAPGWYLELQPSTSAIAAAAIDANAISRGFVVRFVGIGLVVLVVAGFVVLVVARAEKLAQERSQFAAAAAHELRTPLAGLQLYGDMLADGLGDPGKLRDYARRMSEEASRLGRVVSNVLGFSQLERGNLAVDAKPGNVGQALCELAERAQPSLDRAGAVLDLDVPPDLQARFDRDALARIVGNLIDNAEKYSRSADDRTIAMSARTTGNGVEIVVSDRGPGVTQAARERLFHPFARGVDGDGPAGLGLGLALSRSLARAMGGELSYRPSDGGAAFVLQLPAAADHGTRTAISAR